MLTEGTAEALVKVLNDLSDQLREARRQRLNMLDLLVDVSRTVSANNDLICAGLKKAGVDVGDIGKEPR